jgi:hypothetical protein
MSTTDERQMRGLERRLDIALNAPPDRFSGELAAYLGYLATQEQLRTVISSALSQEAQAALDRRAEDERADQAYVDRSVAVARALAAALRPWLADGSLPEWAGELLRSYDQQRALASVEQSSTPWAALRTALEAADLHAGEVARLLREAVDAEARLASLRAAARRRSALAFTDPLARLWGHVRPGTPALAPAEWRLSLDGPADQARRQSSIALLRHELAGLDGGDTALRESLRHDLRRLNAAICEALDARPPAAPALERFRRWCEVYERAALLRRARPGKKATETTRRRKRELIAAELLRSLYAQGFTPITLDMLEGEAAPLDAPQPLLVKVLVVGERETLLRGYVAYVQALRGSERVRRLGLPEAFLVAFLVEPAARYAEPAPLPLAGLLLRSLFIDLTPAGDAGRQPLGVDAIAARLAEEDRLLEFLNTASEDALDSVAGIGPAKAQRIVAARPYGGATDLQRAGLPTSGALYEALRERALRGMQTLVTS